MKESERESRRKASEKYRQKLRDSKLVPVEVWVKPENVEAVKALDERGS